MGLKSNGDSKLNIKAFLRIFLNISYNTKANLLLSNYTLLKCGLHTMAYRYLMEAEQSHNFSNSQSSTES